MTTTNKTPQENKTIVRNFFKCYEEGNTSKIENELLSGNYSLHYPAKPHPLSLTGRKELMKAYRTAFPDMKFNINDQVAEGNMVVTRVTVTGTHKSPFYGVAPTNKKVTITGLSIHRLDNGKITEEWTEFDAMGMYEQLGVISNLSAKSNA